MADEDSSLGRRDFTKYVAGSVAGAGLALPASEVAAQSDTSAGEEIWMFETSGSIVSSPTVVDDVVYFGSDYVYALDATNGSEIWRSEIASGTSAIVVDDIVYIGSGDGMYALNASDGETIWRSEIEVRSSPVVVDGAVYFGSGEGILYALDASDGSMDWYFETESNLLRSSPTVVDESVYFESLGGILYALNTSDGSERWSYRTSFGGNTSPTVANDTVYTSSNQKMYALSTSDGSLNWSYELGRISNANPESSPAVADGVVYVGSSNNVYALDASDGTEEWIYETDSTVNSSPTVADGVVYVGSDSLYSSDDDNLHALSASDGSKLWGIETGDSVTSSPLVVDGIVYFGSKDGKLYALDAGVSGSSGDSRVMLGTLGHHGNWEYADQSIEIDQTDEDEGGSNSTDTNMNISSDRDTTDTTAPSDAQEEDIPPMLVAGALGTLGLVGYGGYRLVSSDSREEKGESVEIPTQTGNKEKQTAEAEERLEETRKSIEDAEMTYEAGDFGSALGHADRAVDKGEAALDGAPESAPDKVAEAEDALGDARNLRRDIRSKKESYEELKDGLEEVKADLGKAGWLLDDRQARPALEKVEDVPERLEEVRSCADEHGFDELHERADSLEQRYDSLIMEAEKELEADTGEPTEIPDTPAESLTYDSIEKIEQVGSGGNADVYRAVADTPRGEVTFALKEPRMSGTLHKETAERMMQEAETWDSLDDHDHIVGVIDYDSEPLPWIAMEYMDGGHIGEQAGEMEFDRALWTAIATTEGVRHAHRRGVAHLDLKPENVLFRIVENAWDVPKVADWGLSKHLLDHSKSVEGLSPQYSAPEQFDSNYGAVDDITDVYQLGAVFYEMFTGEPPFEGEPARVMNKVMNEEPTPPSQIADVPPEIDEILLTTMATEKGDRYESVLYLRDAFQELR